MPRRLPAVHPVDSYRPGVTWLHWPPYFAGRSPGSASPPPLASESRPHTPPPASALQSLKNPANVHTPGAAGNRHHGWARPPDPPATSNPSSATSPSSSARPGWLLDKPETRSMSNSFPGSLLPRNASSPAPSLKTPSSPASDRRSSPPAPLPQVQPHTRPGRKQPWRQTSPAVSATPSTVAFAFVSPSLAFDPRLPPTTPVQGEN